MPKRGENIYKRKDGRWEGRIKKDTALPGGQKYKSVYGKTYGEVKKKMSLARKGLPQTVKCSISVQEAAEIWLKDKREDWKPTTYAVYLHIVEKYINTYLGAVPLHKVDNRVLEMFAANVQKSAPQEKLSRNYLSYLCAVMQRIILYIKKKFGYEMSVPANPVSRDRKRQILLPGEKEMQKLEKYLTEHVTNDTCLGILIALYTGLRIGELCALTWNDLDMEEEVLYIRHNLQRVKNEDDQGIKTQVVLLSPKTADSMRIVPIPPALLSILRRQRRGPSEFVIKGMRNAWIEPRTLQYRFKRILQKCGVEYFNFHMLRHTFATRCIAQGFDVKSLSEILGHSNVQLTLNLYVHSSIQHKKQLMERLVLPSQEDTSDD